MMKKRLESLVKRLERDGKQVATLHVDDIKAILAMMEEAEKASSGTLETGSIVVSGGSFK